MKSNERKGLTLEQIYGEQKGKQLRKKLSESHIGNKISKNTIKKRVNTWKKRYYNGEFENGMKGKIPYSKGKTREEIFGKEKAKELNKKISNKLKKRYENKKNHPRWRGGISKEEYGEDWTIELKKEIRKRDGWKCMLCRCRNKELIVHHIDYNKKNCKENNLITLCRRCHVKIGEKKKEFWKQTFRRILKNE